MHNSAEGLLSSEKNYHSSTQISVSVFTTDDLTREMICWTISPKASGLAAFRALSDISSISVSSPVTATASQVSEYNRKIY